MTAPADAGKTASRAKQKAAEAEEAAQAEKTAEQRTAKQKTAERKSPGNGATTKRAKSTTQSGAPARSGTATRSRSAGAERAYARRDQRRDRSSRESAERRPRASRLPLAPPRPQLAVKPKAKQLQAKMAVSRVPFVVAVMAVLATGLVATLWLSIATVSGSYELRQGKSEINALNEKSERLMRENNYLSSPPAMQKRAAEWGWAPVEDPPHLTWNPDGSPRVVGEPKAAEAPPAPPPPAPPAQPPAQQQPGQEQPGEAAQQPDQQLLAQQVGHQPPAEGDATPSPAGDQSQPLAEGR